MQNEPDDFQSLEGKRIPRRLSVDYISFAAHVDYSQNSKFIDDVKPAHLVSAVLVCFGDFGPVV
jgi:cleavage and polyadenylation specificity factor subunit 3